VAVSSWLFCQRSSHRYGKSLTHSIHLFLFSHLIPRCLEITRLLSRRRWIPARSLIPLLSLSR
jgi:hypothetical protein